MEAAAKPYICRVAYFFEDLSKASRSLRYYFKHSEPAGVPREGASALFRSKMCKICHMADVLFILRCVESPV